MLACAGNVVNLFTKLLKQMVNKLMELHINGFRRKEKINREKEDIEKAKKSLNKRKPSAATARNKPNYSDDGSFVKPKVSVVCW